jgi:hypothetical protein
MVRLCQNHIKEGIQLDAFFCAHGGKYRVKNENDRRTKETTKDYSVKS